MDKYADQFLPIIKNSSIDFLSQMKPTLRPLSSGHIPMDADVTPMDNSGSHKEGVSRTYQGHDGFAPMAVYLEQEAVWTLSFGKATLPERHPSVT